MEEPLSVDEWRKTCPVAETIELNGFRLDNYLGARSEIVVQGILPRVEAVVRDPNKTIPYHVLQGMYG